MQLLPFYHTPSLAAKVGTGSLEDVSHMVEQITAFPFPHASKNKEMEQQQDLSSSCQPHQIFLGGDTTMRRKTIVCCSALWMGPLSEL